MRSQKSSYFLKVLSVSLAIMAGSLSLGTSQVSAEEKPATPAAKSGSSLSDFSLVLGLGSTEYASNGSGAFGTGFINVIYKFMPTWEVGIGYQPGSAYNNAFLEVNYLLGNWYFGVQGGSISYTGNPSTTASGSEFGVQAGYDYEFMPHFEIGGNIGVQSLTWSSGTSNQGFTSGSTVTPFVVLTYTL
jgi:hypothetical protein